MAVPVAVPRQRVLLSGGNYSCIGNGTLATSFVFRGGLWLHQQQRPYNRFYSQEELWLL